MSESGAPDCFGDEADKKDAHSISRRALLMGLFALPIAAVVEPTPAQAQFNFPFHLLFRGGGSRGGRRNGAVRSSRRNSGKRTARAGRRHGRGDGGGGGSSGGSGGGLGKADY